MAVNPLKDISITAEVLTAIEGGSKIKAIKLLRESAGIGLKEAKELVDMLVDSSPSTDAAQAKGVRIPGDVLAAIESGRKVEAIKLLRESTGSGLKEARDVIDDYMANHPAVSEQFIENRRGNGIPQEWVLRFVIMIIGLAIAYWVLWK